MEIIEILLIFTDFEWRCMVEQNLKGPRQRRLMPNTRPSVLLVLSASPTPVGEPLSGPESIACMRKGQM